MTKADSAGLDLSLSVTSIEKMSSALELKARLRQVQLARERLALESARLDAIEDALQHQLQLVEKPIIRQYPRPCRICLRFTLEKFNDLPQCRKHLDKTTGGDEALNAIV